jgi:uncharacterized repeat protein (TIGR03803 family)
MPFLLLTLLSLVISVPLALAQNPSAAVSLPVDNTLPNPIPEPPKDKPYLRVLYHFGPPLATDPLWIKSPGFIAQGPDDSLYMTSPQGGKKQWGTIFKVMPEGNMSVLFDFDYTHGRGPLSGLVKGQGGNFYGTTYEGGEVGTGTIFTTGAQPGEPSIIWSFRNGKPNRLLRPGEKDYTDQEKLDWGASYPISPPVQARSGRWFGVTSYSNNQQYGTLYTLGSGGDYHAIQKFDGIIGNYPVTLTPGVVDDYVYGTALYGPSRAPLGMVFKAGDGGIQPLHVFDKIENGGKSVSVMQASNGRLYGTSPQGGIFYGFWYGLIYSLNSDGSDYKILRKFSGADGAVPVAGLLEASDGLLYGTTSAGGKFGRGVAYRIDKDGQNFEVLHHFDFFQTGRKPLANQMQHSHNGLIYGTTVEGGKYDKGVFYCLDFCLKPRTATKQNPGSRVCCALGDGALDPAKLPHHYYGRTDPSLFGDPFGLRDGYIYTAVAGLVDMGHVRDTADMTMFIFDTLFAGYTCMGLYEGWAHVPEIAFDREEKLQIAASIAYVESLAHELRTWRTSEDFSSFSPEDMTSNMIGIELARRAIRAIGYTANFDEYNKAVDHELDASQLNPQLLINELKFQSKENTEEALEKIKGPTGWYDSHWYTANSIPELYRRNFDGRPWKIGLPFDAPVAKRWLTPAYFERYYNKFDYTMYNPVLTETSEVSGVTEDNMKQITYMIYNQFIATHKGMAQWP